MTSETGFLVEARLQTAPFPVLIFFLAASISLTTYIIYFIIKESRFRHRAQYTVASVVAVGGTADLNKIEGPIVSAARGRAGQAPVVAFTGPDGRLHSYIVRRPVIVRFSVGSQARICYDPDNPSRVFLDSPVDPSRYVAAIMGVCGIVVAIASAVISIHRLI